MYDKDPVPGGGRTEGIRVLLQGGSPGGVAFRVRSVDPDPLYRAGPGSFSAQGCVADHREADEEAGGEGLVVSTADVSYGGGGI